MALYIKQIYLFILTMVSVNVSDSWSTYVNTALSCWEQDHVNNRYIICTSPTLLTLQS